MVDLIFKRLFGAKKSCQNGTNPTKLSRAEEGLQDRGCQFAESGLFSQKVGSFPSKQTEKIRIFGLLRDAEREADGCEKGVELFWRTAYYEPIQAMKMRMYSDFMNHMIHIFIGEIIAFLLTPSRNVARYYIMLGDLMR